MKKTFLLTFLVIMMISLAACSAAGIPTQISTATSSTDATQQVTVSELVAGTLKLQDTNQAVTQAQASELLTLWLAYKEVNNSDVAAQQEIDALVKQIAASMTDEQIAAIQGMNITSQDIQSLADSSGASTASSEKASTSGSSSNSNQMGGPGGDMGGGMGGEMSGDMPSGDDMAMAAPAQGSNSNQEVSTDLVLALVDPLTDMLAAVAA